MDRPADEIQERVTVDPAAGKKESPFGGRGWWIATGVKIAFWSALALWGVLLIDECRINTGQRSLLAWIKVFVDEDDLHLPQGLRRLLPGFTLRIDMARHSEKGLLICFTAIPFLLHWAWGKGGEARRSQWLYGLVLLLLMVPATLALLLALKHHDWPPSSANWVARGLFFSVMLAALPFLPGVRNLAPLRQMMFFVVAAAGYHVAASTLKTHNAANTYNNLEIGHWRLASVVWDALFWVPNWWVALWAAAVVTMVFMVVRPWKWRCPFGVTGMALGLAVGGSTAAVARMHRPLLTFHEQREVKSWQPYEGRSLQTSLQPVAIRRVKNFQTGALSVPCAVYELDLPPDPQGDYEEIAPSPQNRFQADVPGWQLIWWSRPVVAEGMPHTRLTFLLANLENPEALKAAPERGSWQRGLTMKGALWTLEKDLGSLNQFKHQGSYGNEYVWHPTKMSGVEFHTRVDKPGNSSKNIIIRAGSAVSVWHPPLLWRSFEERAFSRPPDKTLRRMVIGDFSTGATLGWTGYMNGDITDDRYWHYQRILKVPTGTPMERSALKPGESIYEGDQFRDLEAWWAAAEGRIYRLRRETRNGFDIYFILPKAEDLSPEMGEK